MVRWIACAALFAVLALGVRAEDDKKDNKTTKATDALKALQDDYLGKIRAEKDQEKRQELINEFFDKLLDHASKNAKDESAPQALAVVIQNTRGKNKARDAALAALKKDHVKSKLNSQILRTLAGTGTDPDAVAIVKAVYKDNPDKVTRALAAKALASAYERQAKTAEQISKSEKVREAYEQRFGKDAVEKMLEDGKAADKLVKEYRKALKEDFKGLVVDLSVGEKAPATVGANLDGKEVKLSDLKGKVVVLDFWATWCGPCVKMIPHNREVVKNLAEKPFVLVSISADAKKETLESFMKKNEMPWTHWWDGPGGKVATLWEIEAYPTLYIIDHKGVIQHKQVGFGPTTSKELDAIVEKLVKEAVNDKTKN